MKKKEMWQKWGRRVVAGVAILLLPVSVVYLVKADPREGWPSWASLSVPPDAPDARAKYFNIMPLVVYCAWTIGPPIYFLVEYLWLFPKDEERLAHHKYSLELAQKIWAGIAVVLSLVLLVKYNIKV